MTVKELCQQLMSVIANGNGDVPVVVNNFYTESLDVETEDLMTYLTADGDKFVISVEI